MRRYRKSYVKTVKKYNPKRRTFKSILSTLFKRRWSNKSYAKKSNYKKPRSTYSKYRSKPGLKRKLYRYKKW